MSSFNSGWYVIFASTRQEKKIAERLSKMKITFFLPFIQQQRQWLDRKKTVQVLLFPNYIFIKINSLTQIYEVMECEGFRYFVKFGGMPAMVGQEIIDQLKIVVAGGENVSVSTDYFEIREKITIVNGPLTGLNAEVVEHSGENKLLVKVNLFNRNILLDLPVAHVDNYRAMPANTTFNKMTPQYFK